MNVLRVLLVDDEPLALALLRSKLSKLESIEIVGECKNGREAIDSVLNLSPDAVFLDIQMPVFSGLDVVKKLQNDYLPLVVFTTAYEQYAIDAFDLNAVDYLVKPLEELMLMRAVDRLFARLGKPHEILIKSRILNAIETMTLREVWQETSQRVINDDFGDHQASFGNVVIKEREEITILKQHNIQWIDAAGDYVCIHSKGNTYIKRSTLTDILKSLDSTLFKRVHRSTIVNLNFITSVIPAPKGECFLLLHDNEKIKVSRNYKQEIKDFLKNN